MPDLTVRLINGLELADPFMVASSHWTATENAIRSFSPLLPAALTLKTTSNQHGATHAEAIGTRNQRPIQDESGRDLGRWTDGPKALELWDGPTTASMLQYANDHLSPQTQVGISLLEGEDYGSISAELEAFATAGYKYAELNCKYVLRNLPAGLSFGDHLTSQLSALKSSFERFLEVFASAPKFLKLNREFWAWSSHPIAESIVDLAISNNTAIIVANSLRTRVPPGYTAERKELTSGVLTGHHLFLQTYDWLVSIATQHQSLKAESALVASGGVTSFQRCLDSWYAGAAGIQLCTFFDEFKPQGLRSLRTALSACMSATQCETMPEFFRKIQSKDASVTHLYPIRNTFKTRLDEKITLDGIRRAFETTLKDELNVVSRSNQ